MTTPNTYTNWPSLTSLASIPSTLELLGTTGDNEPVRFLASLLAAQVSAGEDGTSVRVAYTRTLTTTRPPQPTPTRSVATGVVTLADPWVWDGPPTGTNPYIWAAVGNIPADRTMNASFDTAFRLGGLDGDDGAPGDDGANGAGLQIIYRTAATSDTTAPATPTGGTRGNDGLLDTLPTGWQATPSTATGYRWASVVMLPSLRSAVATYSAPFIYNGIDGNATYIVFRWHNSATTLPVGLPNGEYDLANNGTELLITGGQPRWTSPSELNARLTGYPYLWGVVAHRNPATRHVTPGHPFRLTGVDGTNGTDGAPGATGDSIAILYHGAASPDTAPTDPTTWNREQDGTPDANNPPAGWSTTVPSTRHIWIVVAHVPSDPTAAITFRSAVRITGIDGADGAAAAAGNSVQVIFQRSATTPATPTGGTRTPSDGSVATYPMGWTATIPTGDDPLYGVVMSIPGDRAAALGYSAPFTLSGTPGARGAQGISGYGTVPIFEVVTSGGRPPDTPTGGSYANGVFTPPFGWVLPSGVGDPSGNDEYVSFVSIAPDGSISYTTPRQIGEAGARGDDGDDGTDGVNGSGIVIIFRRGALRPDNPTGGRYERATGTFTPPTGWSTTIPAGTDVLWAVFVQVGPQEQLGGTAPLTYTGVFTLGEALNITEIRNDLAALQGDARLPAAAIAGISSGVLDPRVDALEHATVDLNAVRGRTIESTDTTDAIHIALTGDEDPSALPENRWAKNIVTDGNPTHLWIRIGQSAAGTNTPALDLRNYIIQVTTPDESEIVQEIAASSFDARDLDTSTVYDYWHQGGDGHEPPQYTWLNTSHVRIRKYSAADRHSTFSGITIIPDVGSVPDDERVAGELRRSGDDTLQVFNRDGAWQSVYDPRRIDQLDTVAIVQGGNWDAVTGNQVGAGGLSLRVVDAGAVTARTQQASTPATLGEVSAVITPPDNAGRTIGWSPRIAGVYDIDVTGLLTNRRNLPGEQPGSLWLEAYLHSGTDFRPVLRGQVVTASYYEPLHLKLTGPIPMLANEVLYFLVRDAFGVVRWNFEGGELKVRLNQQQLFADHTMDDTRFLRDPYGVERRYDPDLGPGTLQQKTLTLYSRGEISSTITVAHAQARLNDLYANNGYRVSLRQAIDVSEWQAVLEAMTPENDNVGASGNRWRVTRQRGAAYGVEVTAQGADDPFPGAGLITLTFPTDAPRLNEQATTGAEGIFVDRMRRLFWITGSGSDALRFALDDADNTHIELTGGADAVETLTLDAPVTAGPPRTAVAQQADITIFAREGTPGNPHVQMVLKAGMARGPLGSDPNGPSGNPNWSRSGNAGNRWRLEFVVRQNTNNQTQYQFLTSPISARHTMTVYIDPDIMASDGRVKLQTVLGTDGATEFPADSAGAFLAQNVEFLHHNVDGNDFDFYLPFEDNEVGSRVHYDFSGGADSAGEITYDGEQFHHSNWGNWYEEDPHPGSEHTLYIAHSTATRASDFTWSYGPWNWFPSGLGAHHVQYAAVATGPWHAEQETTDQYWRHRNTDGTWGPGIFYGETTTGQWRLLGRFQVASASASDSTFSDRVDWTNALNQSRTHFGRTGSITAFDLRHYSEYGWKVEHWRNGHSPGSGSVNLISVLWQAFPIAPGTREQSYARRYVPVQDNTVVFGVYNWGNTRPQMYMAQIGEADPDTYLSRQDGQQGDDDAFARGGMLNMVRSTSASAYHVDRLSYFSRWNNRPLLVELWGKLK